MVTYRHIEHHRSSNWNVLLYSKLLQKELVKKTSYYPRYVILYLGRGGGGGEHGAFLASKQPYTMFEGLLESYK